MFSKKKMGKKNHTKGGKNKEDKSKKTKYNRRFKTFRGNEANSASIL